MSRRYVSFFLSANKRSRRTLWRCAGEYRGRSVKGFLLYVKAKILDDTEELIYKRYMADGLKYVTESISQAFGGKYLYVSFLI